MSYSLLTADRATHVKVVVVALVSATVVLLVGINVRPTIATHAGSTPIKANQATTLAVQVDSIVR